MFFKRNYENKIVVEGNYCKCFFNEKTISEDKLTWIIDREGTNELTNNLELLYELKNQKLEPIQNYQIFEWTRVNGSYVREGEPILFIQKGKPELYKYVFKKVWLGEAIKSPADGYLQIEIQSGNEVNDGDLLFQIDTAEMLSDNSNKYEYLYNRFDIPIEVRSGAKDVWNPRDKPTYIAAWLVPNGQYVDANTPVLKIKCGNIVETYFEYTLPAKKSGFISFARFIPSEHPSVYGQIKQKEHLYTIFKSFEDIFYNKFRIERDDFSGDQSLIWEVIGGFERPFNSDNYNPIGGINLKSTYGNDIFIAINNLKGLDYLVIYYFGNELKLQKGDKIFFLFENKEVITFELSSRGTKSNSSWNHLRKVKVPITVKEIKTFAIDKLDKWKIEKSNNGETITGDVGNLWYTKEDTHMIFQNLVTEYFEILNSQFENYKPIFESASNKNSLKSEKCFVYLMIDTTNNFHKIGISNKPYIREKTLQSEKPTIELICSKEFPSRVIAESIEKSLHSAFASKRIRGEWFDLSTQELDDIKKTLS